MADSNEEQSKAQVTPARWGETNPSHYRSHPSGIECIQVVEHMDFCLGNAIKYIWRAGLKDNKLLDLEKAAWYINRAINKAQKEQETTDGNQSRV